MPTERDWRLIRRSYWPLQLLVSLGWFLDIILSFALLSKLISTLYLVFRSSWAYLFNNDPKVVALVASILPLVALFQVFDATSAVTGGVLRARGKQVSSDSILEIRVNNFLHSIVAGCYA
jgi:predicted Co/Zn/Cd cation transporter (cation efflux family)